uniref:Folylpolyglutamate synthase n=1 Tax=Romanomermis culicivorax TaxID=13658 RepID=A0A915KZY8_ROMCU
MTDGNRQPNGTKISLLFGNVCRLHPIPSEKATVGHAYDFLRRLEIFVAPSVPFGRRAFLSAMERPVTPASLIYKYLEFLIKSSKLTIRTMSIKESYEFTIATLNSLQSNATTVAQARARRSLNAEENLATTKSCLKRSGLQVSDLVPLNIIHVAGTKGKGSVCALTESILRSHGYKTGFFSSPHLVHVRERIKINGLMISKKDFCRYFWKVYDRLESTKSDEDSFMPPYFKFLTILAFHVFLDQKVDVGIFEVGIGGAFDCTNVLTKPVICAVTTLDYDHVEILGDTLQKIAWQKTGIFKEGSIAICADQEPEALPIIGRRSIELKCPCYLAPKFSAYGEEYLKIGIPGSAQKENASLALQISHAWMSWMKTKNHSINVVSLKNGYINLCDAGSLDIAKAFKLSEADRIGLRDCKWPGRCQKLVKNNSIYYLDGAHTPKSMKLCVEWFLENCRKSNVASVAITVDSALKVCKMNEKTWLDLCNSNIQICAQFTDSNTAQHENGRPVVVETAVKPCVSSALTWIEENFPNQEIDVLITGSLHLVGGSLRFSAEANPMDPVTLHEKLFRV